MLTIKTALASMDIHLLLIILFAALAIGSGAVPVVQTSRTGKAPTVNYMTTWLSRAICFSAISAGIFFFPMWSAMN